MYKNGTQALISIIQAMSQYDTPEQALKVLNNGELLTSYRDSVLRNENKQYQDIVKRMTEDKEMVRALHALMGVADEAGELMSAYKRYFFYGKVVDKRNVLEECGDMLWFITLLLDSIGATLDDAIEANNRKLAARYHSGSFSNDQALERDLDRERKALDGVDGGTNG